MKICWDNLENIYLTKKGNLKKGTCVLIEKISCKRCLEPYITQKKPLGINESKFCCKSCQLSDKGNPFYGKKHSSNSKKKMSKTKTGQIPWNKGKLNIYSEQTILKMSKSRKGQDPWNKGKICPQISIGLKGKYCGPKNWNWKGGISKFPYCFEFTDDLKEYIKYRDVYKCQNPQCYSKKSDYLCVHHIDYDKKHCVEENLITLCRSCNSQANFDREWWESFYKEIIKRKGL